MELVDQPTIGERDQPDVLSLLRQWPAARAVAASAALGHSDVLVSRLVFHRSVAKDLLEGGQRVASSLIVERDDLAASAMDLQRNRRLAKGLLVEPAVGLELEAHVLLAPSRLAGSASSRGSRSRSAPAA